VGGKGKRKRIDEKEKDEDEQEEDRIDLAAIVKNTLPPLPEIHRAADKIDPKKLENEILKMKKHLDKLLKMQEQVKSEEGEKEKE
jgi:hypothetical protein